MYVFVISIIVSFFSAYFKIGDYNVICVDWKQYSTDLTYAVAKARAKHIGLDIAKVLRKITYNLTKGVERLHLIGHSMGAHIVGFTGKNLTNQIPRITGYIVLFINIIINVYIIVICVL